MTEKDVFLGKTVIAEEEESLVEYDESNYPANAESGDECGPAVTTDISDSVQVLALENSGVTRKLEEQYSISEDVSCVVCSEVLVDPCTLHCGHSFCLLCLASIWKSKSLPSPNNLQCPVCREPWGSYPGINIQLRNIIERSHGKLVEIRRGQRSEADAATLAQYQQAKKKIFVQARAVVYRFQQQRWFIVLLALALCGAVVIMVVLVTVLAVSLSGPGGEYMRRPVTRWNHDDVMSWVGGLGNWAHHNVTRAFTKEKITGTQLLMLDHAALKSFGLDNEFHIQSLLMAMQQLKQNDHSAPRNFNEFMAAHRKETLVLAVLYKLWPRLSFLYSYMFDYYSVFLPIWQYTLSYPEEEHKDSTPSEEPSNWQLFMFSVEVILVPHYIVGMCAWHWSSSHGFLCMAILIHCLWTTQREAKQAIAYVSSRHAMHWRQEMMILGKGLLYNVVTCAGLVICSAILWPVVPYFLCNFLLHWTIWYTAFTLACKPVKLLIVRRPQHIRRPRQDGIP